MSTSPKTEFYVPEDGIVVLPKECCGKKFKVVLVEEELSSEDEKLLRMLKADYEFRHPKTLQQLVEEQGVKPIGTIDELIPEQPAWESDEEFYAFLEAIGEDVNFYR